MRHALLAASAVAVLGTLGRLDDDREALSAANEAQRREFMEQAKRDAAAVPPIAGVGWREILPGVEQELQAAPELSRQEARALQRRIARITASQAHQNAREVARLDRKSRHRKRGKP